jgi:hypothetical protein
VNKEQDRQARRLATIRAREHADGVVKAVLQAVIVVLVAWEHTYEKPFGYEEADSILGALEASSLPALGGYEPWIKTIVRAARFGPRPALLLAALRKAILLILAGPRTAREGLADPETLAYWRDLNRFNPLAW